MFLTPTNYIRTAADDEAEAARLAMVAKRHKRSERAISDQHARQFRARLRDLH